MLSKKLLVKTLIQCMFFLACLNSQAAAPKLPPRNIDEQKKSDVPPAPPLPSKNIGTTKPVEGTKKEAPSSPKSSLLEQIEKGTTLKHVEKSAQEPSSESKNIGSIQDIFEKGFSKFKSGSQETKSSESLEANKNEWDEQPESSTAKVQKLETSIRIPSDSPVSLEKKATPKSDASKFKDTAQQTKVDEIKSTAADIKSGKTTLNEYLSQKEAELTLTAENKMQAEEARLKGVIKLLSRRASTEGEESPDLEKTRRQLEDLQDPNTRATSIKLSVQDQIMQIRSNINKELGITSKPTTTLPKEAPKVTAPEDLFTAIKARASEVEAASTVKEGVGTAKTEQVTKVKAPEKETPTTEEVKIELLKKEAAEEVVTQKETEATTKKPSEEMVTAETIKKEEPAPEEKPITKVAKEETKEEEAPKAEKSTPTVESGKKIPPTPPAAPKPTKEKLIPKEIVEKPSKPTKTKEVSIQKMFNVTAPAKDQQMLYARQAVTLNQEHESTLKNIAITEKNLTRAKGSDQIREFAQKLSDLKAEERKQNLSINQLISAKHSADTQRVENAKSKVAELEDALTNKSLDKQEKNRIKKELNVAKKELSFTQAALKTSEKEAQLKSKSFGKEIGTYTKLINSQTKQLDKIAGQIAAKTKQLQKSKGKKADKLSAEIEALQEQSKNTELAIAANTASRMESENQKKALDTIELIKEKGEEITNLNKQIDSIEKAASKLNTPEKKEAYKRAHGLSVLKMQLEEHKDSLPELQKQRDTIFNLE